jgi:hypothetical protein
MSCWGKCEPGTCWGCDATPEERQNEMDRCEEHWQKVFANWGKPKLPPKAEQSNNDIFRGSESK